MQNPVGTWFNPAQMRMELHSMSEIIFNDVAQAKFVHTISAGYVTGAIFMLSISAYYLLKKSNTDIAKRSIVTASAFGLLSICSVIVLGDESGYTSAQNQKMKLAAIEAMWNTEESPADFTIFGLPNMQTKHTDYAVKVPYLLGLIATRSIDIKILGINDLVQQNYHKIKLGIEEYKMLQQVNDILKTQNIATSNGKTIPYHQRIQKHLSENSPIVQSRLSTGKYKDLNYGYLFTAASGTRCNDTKSEEQYTQVKHDPMCLSGIVLKAKDKYNNLGYALLVKKYNQNITTATDSDIVKASLSTIPNVPLLFWSFRIMVGCGFIMLLLFGLSFYNFAVKKSFNKKWLLIICVASIPLPWIASELGWIVAECGRQPWVIDGVLPTFSAASSISLPQVISSTTFFVVLYSMLLAVDAYLLLKYIKLGPDYIE
jgi:cytochrome d ubiquinol oxidase subunit I